MIRYNHYNKMYDFLYDICIFRRGQPQGLKIINPRFSRVLRCFQSTRGLYAVGSSPTSPTKKNPVSVRVSGFSSFLVYDFLYDFRNLPKRKTPDRSQGIFFHGEFIKYGLELFTVLSSNDTKRNPYNRRRKCAPNLYCS